MWYVPQTALIEHCGTYHIEDRKDQAGVLVGAFCAVKWTKTVEIAVGVKPAIFRTWPKF